MLHSTAKIVCIGRNYVAHAQELGNAVPDYPLLFIKPQSSVQSVTQLIDWQRKLGSCHYECELCVRVGRDLSMRQQYSHAELLASIDAVTLGLDLTLRDLQTELKKQGYPWERAKAFDGACVLAEWLDASVIEDWQTVQFEFYQNQQLKQQGHTGNMIFSIAEIMAKILENFSLQAGDVIMTGTPAGVGELHSKDQLLLKLFSREGEHQWQVEVA